MTVFRITGFNNDWTAVVEALNSYDAMKKVLEDGGDVQIRESDTSKWQAKVLAKGISYEKVSA